ncbi:MAG: hypothetical protein K6F94_07905 [Bacteroidaceae bacterium]|nr:hypothetical protein [Bacteroidaceae bacterium]
MTFSEECRGSGTADDGITWTITSDAAESSYEYRGIHYGTSSAAVSYLNLTTSAISGTITQIVVNASGAKGTSAKLNVTVGGNAFGSQKNLTSSSANYTFEGSASGEIVISLTQTSAMKALYVKSVTVTYTPQDTPQTSVLADSYDINVESTGCVSSLDITYSGMNDISPSVAFYEADGITPKEYNWISAEIDGQNDVSFAVEANSGMAIRQAYMKVLANGVSSGLITISQNACDFASLPLDFDGDASSLPTGFTASGLGSYDSSPRIKFDTTGDFLVLKLNASPRTLSFNINGLSFSGSTFKVQTSADGLSYTDLATYTSLGDVSNEFFGNMAADVRYIRWIYSNKNQGNVALGRISLGYNRVLVGSALYTTYVAGDNISIPDGLTAYIATNVNGETIHLEEVTDAPTGAALIIRGDAAGIYTLGSDYEGAYADAISSSPNILQASDGTVTGDGSTIYALGQREGSVGFYLVKSGAAVPRGKAYIVVDTPAAIKNFLKFNTGTPTAVNRVPSGSEAITTFSLSGQRVAGFGKGIFIRNGHKYLVE